MNNVTQLTGAAGAAVGTAMGRISGGAVSGGSKALRGGVNTVRSGFAGKSATEALPTYIPLSKKTTPC